MVNYIVRIERGLSGWTPTISANDDVIWRGSTAASANSAARQSEQKLIEILQNPPLPLAKK